MDLFIRHNCPNSHNVEKWLENIIGEWKEWLWFQQGHGGANSSAAWGIFVNHIIKFLKTQRQLSSGATKTLAIETVKSHLESGFIPSDIRINLVVTVLAVNNKIKWFLMKNHYDMLWILTIAKCYY